MSHTLKTIVGTRHDKDIHVGSYSGGKGVGQCIQMQQGHIVDGLQMIKMDEAQAAEMVETLQKWLDRKNERDCNCHGVLMKEAGVQPHTIACEWNYNQR